MKSPITSHVLDTALGRPAEGIAVVVSGQSESGWTERGRGITNSDGRVPGLLEPGSLTPGVYRVIFETADYLRRQGHEVPFYPEVSVVVHITEVDEHYHIPLLLSPFGYSTYRGS